VVGIGLSELIEMWQRILTLSERPESDEFRLLIKVTVAALFLIGGVGIALHLLLTLAQGMELGQ
jgi:preprotein translocase subunit Sss1